MRINNSKLTKHKKKKSKLRKTKKLRKKSKNLLIEQFIKIKKKTITDNKLKLLISSVKQWQNYEIISPIKWGIYRYDTKKDVEYSNIDIFQKYVEDPKYKKIIKKHLIYEDEKILVFVPHEDPDGKNTWLSTSINKNNNYNKTNSSQIHYIAIPKIRIWNIITLERKHLELLIYIRTILTKLIKLALRSDDCYLNICNKETPIKTVLNKNILDKMINNINNCSMDENFYMPYGQNFSNFTAKKYHDNNIETSVHLFPVATVYWLHIHGYVSSLNTLKNTLLYYKQLKINNIIPYLENNRRNFIIKDHIKRLCKKDSDKKKLYFYTLEHFNLKL